MPIEVKAGQSLRSTILNAPTSENLITVEAGVIFNEVIELPAKERSSPLVIQSSRIAELPPDKPITPSSAVLMPKIIPPQSELAIRAVQTQPSARFYSLLGIEVTHDPTKDTRTLVSLGDPSQKTLPEIPHSLVFDRCYIHGHPDRASVRGIALNSAKTDILNCYISDIHDLNNDSQAVCGWAGPGPYRILNSYLEAAGENVMFGGGDPGIQGLIPSDIEIRRCYFFKPFTWKIGHSSYAGKPWVVKNLFETKNCRRVIVEGNVFENNWTHGQAGFGILIKCNNQDSTAPWSVTEDLLFQHNIIRSERGLNMLLIENLPKLSAIGKRIFIRNNIWFVGYTVFQGPNHGEDVQITHNTWFSEHGNNFTFYGNPTKGLVFDNNLGAYAGFGIRGDGEGVGAGVQEGTATFNAYSPGTWNAKGNLIPGANPALYPPNNFYPPLWGDVQFDEVANNLKPTSPYKGKATDGKDPGCDYIALLAAQQAPKSTPLPIPDPTPKPMPTNTPSLDGTKAVEIVDSTGAKWTFDAQRQTLRNGIPTGGGLGLMYKFFSTVVYVLGVDSPANWYQWTNNKWSKFGMNEPGTPGKDHKKKLREAQVLIEEVLNELP